MRHRLDDRGEVITHGNGGTNLLAEAVHFVEIFFQTTEMPNSKPQKCFNTKHFKNNTFNFNLTHRTWQEISQYADFCCIKML